VNKLTSVLGAAAVIAIAVVFILQFRPASNAGRTDNGPQCAIEVHGSCAVTTPEFQAAYRLVAWNLDPGKLKAMGLRRHVADGLLERWVLNQDAKRLGISVSEDDLSRELYHGRAYVSLPAVDLNPSTSLARSLGLGATPTAGVPGEDMFRPLIVKSPKTKKYDPKVYDKQVRQITLLSTPDFRAFQREEVIAARVRELVRARVRVGEDEAYEQFARDKSSVTLDYVRFDRRFYADLVVDQSPKAVEAWSEGHKEEIDKVWEARKSQIMPECRSVREIAFKFDATTASDEDKAKIKARVERAQARLAKGEDFADVARAMSDSTTAMRGGEIGCVARGKSPKPLEDAVAALGAGKVSEPVSTEKYVYLIKLEQIARDAEAEKMGRAQTARELYLAQEADRLALEATKNVLAAVKGGKPLKDALEQHVAELKAKAPVTNGAPEKKADKKKADKKDKKATDKKDDQAADKKDDEDNVPVTFDNHPERPTLQTTMAFSAAGDPISGVKSPGELLKTAFALEKPGDAPLDAVAAEDGYVAISLKEKAPATKEMWEKERDRYLSGMRAYKASDALTAYVKRLQGALAADAKYTKEVVEEPKGSAKGTPTPIEDDGE
jgi:peptidyl-prolyl cis-trans isomerase D